MIGQLNGGTLNQPVARWNKVLTSIFQAFLASETTFSYIVNENLRICLLRQTVLLIPTNTICCHLQSIDSLTFYAVFSTSIVLLLSFISSWVFYAPYLYLSFLLIHPSLLVLSTSLNFHLRSKKPIAFSILHHPT